MRIRIIKLLTLIFGIRSLLVTSFALLIIFPIASHAEPSKIATGFAHTIGIKSDGTLWTWGYNWYGQLGNGTTTDVYSPVMLGLEKKWINVSAGLHHSIALKSDGTLWTWGYNWYGQLGDGATTDIYIPSKIGADNDWISIYSGDNHTIALKSDGSLWAWGYNGHGQIGDGTITDRHTPTMIGSDYDWVSVAAGSNHTVALKSNGTLWAWGRNLESQLGDGTTTDRHAPTMIGTDKDWVSVATGSNHTVAIKSGTLWVWGDNYYGQLGDGTTTTISSPMQIGTDNTWIYIFAGNSHTIALKTDGSLWVWGLNSQGQLGDGTTVDKHSPVQLGVDRNWIATGTGGSGYSLMRKSDGSLWAWGGNGYGQLGDGTTNNQASPLQLLIDVNWVSTSTGTFHMTALKSDGTLWAWGRNTTGQLGLNATDTCNFEPCLMTPGQVGIDNDWISTATGNHHSFALKSDGTIWAWGQNEYYELGDVTQNNRFSPGQVGALAKWRMIATGSHSTFAIKANGTLWAWGHNSHCQLGDGTWLPGREPQRTGDDRDWVTVSSGHEHTIALKSDGSLWAWGSNEFGQLGRTAPNRCGGSDALKYPGQVGMERDWVSIAAGTWHTLAIKSDGTLWAWGSNSSGQLGDGTTTDRYYPVQIGTENTWRSLFKGRGSFTLALKSDGTMWSWGGNGDGQLGDGTIVEKHAPVKIGSDNDWVSMSKGGHSAIAVKTEGTLWTWGLNNYSQLGDGTLISRNYLSPTTNPPSADTGGPYAAIEGETITLDGSGSTDLDGNIVTYEWDIDDDGTYDFSSSSLTQNYSYDQQGTYNIRLRVTDDLGASDEDTTIADISDSSPTASFTAVPLIGSAPLTVDFINNSTGHDQPLSYEWDFDDNGVVDSTIQDPSYVYTTPGTYTVKLTVTDSDGTTNSLIRADYITVTLPSYLLTLNIIGNGNVTSSPLGIACFSGIGDCTEGYEQGTSVTLTAAPSDGSSIFAGWTGGGCSGTGNCVVVMSVVTDVTALFNVCSHDPARNSQAALEYISLQDAYNAAADGNTIQSHETAITENLNIDIDKSVTISGGYDCSYTGKTGVTTLNGNMTITNGTLNIEDLIIQ